LFELAVARGLLARPLFGTGSREEWGACVRAVLFCGDVLAEDLLELATPLRRFARGVGDPMDGSAICRRLPGATLMPVILFQRRNWVSETPKRSAIVTRVSPRRAV